MISIDSHILYRTMMLAAVIPMPLAAVTRTISLAAAIAILLLALTWMAWLSPRASVPKHRMLLLMVTTASYLWFVLAMKWPTILAEPHSFSRFAVIDVNFVVMLACSIAAFRGHEKRKNALGFAGLLTTYLWHVQAAINSVV